MNNILSFLGLHREAPAPRCAARVADDEVVPVSFFDDQDLYRKMFLSFTFQFDCVLNAEKLRTSLSGLIERPGWRKLGGRMRLDEVEGKLFLHIPTRFTPDRPAIGYAHENYDCKIREHPLASQIPSLRTDLEISPSEEENRPRFLPSTSTFRSFAVRPGGPTSLADLLHSDEPQVSLFVVTFEDATLVSLTWPHVSMDGMAFSSLLGAWSAVLHGREEDVPQVGECNVDPAGELGLKEVPGHPLGGKVLGFWGAVCFALRSAIDRLSDPGVESRMLFLPGEWVEELKRGCLAEVVGNTSRPMDERESEGREQVWEIEPPYLSTNDVLISYLTRTFTTINLAAFRPVAMFSLADIRRRLPSHFGGTNSTSMTTYLTNLLILSPTYTTPSELRTAPLGLTAKKVREALRELTGEEKMVEGMLWLGRKTFEMLPFRIKMPYKTAVVMGEPGAFRTVVTNWESLGFYRGVLDLGGAVVDAGVEGKAGGVRREKKGTPVHYFADTLSGGDNPWRHSWVVFGKDPEGNYWASGWLPRKTWESVDRDIGEGKVDASVLREWGVGV